MLCVDNYSRFEIKRFPKKEDDITVLGDILATHIAPAGLKMGIIRTDGGGEFEGYLQDLLNKLGIKRE